MSKFQPPLFWMISVGLLSLVILSCDHTQDKSMVIYNDQPLHKTTLERPRIVLNSQPGLVIEFAGLRLCVLFWKKHSESLPSIIKSPAVGIPLHNPKPNKMATSTERHRTSNKKRLPIAKEEPQNPKLGLIGWININQASTEQLMLLPGIGKSRAELICSYRSKRQFRKSKELTRIKGIGSKRYSKLAPFIRIAGETTIRKLKPGTAQ